MFRPRERAFKQFKCPRPQCVNPIFCMPSLLVTGCVYQSTGFVRRIKEEDAPKSSINYNKYINPLQHTRYYMCCLLQHYRNPATFLQHVLTYFICGNKLPTRCNRCFIADLIACSTCFGHHYAHHQELKSIIQWLLPVVFRAAASCKPDI